MTAITRETYYGALWTLLKGVSLTPAIQTFDRRVRLLQDLEDGELPALFLAVGHQPTERDFPNEPRHKLGAKVFLYCANPDQHTSADIFLNQMIDAVEAAIEPIVPLEPQTLGGLAHYAWIAGTTEVFQAPNGTRAAAIVPIEMLVA
jgi:hypothetical protein